MASPPARSTTWSRRLASLSGISKSEVSRICGELDRDLEAFRDRPLDHAEFVYVFLDATYVKGRVRGRVVLRRGHRDRCHQHRRPRGTRHRRR